MKNPDGEIKKPAEFSEFQAAHPFQRGFEKTACGDSRSCGLAQQVVQSGSLHGGSSEDRMLQWSFFLLKLLYWTTSSLSADVKTRLTDISLFVVRVTTKADLGAVDSFFF